MKIRIKFRKYGIMKFIGHLDIMRYFQKAMRRADIDICYSAGFSPHMIMSFASPLGVGLTSDGEYLDIEIGNELSSEAAVKRLNGVMAEGVEVLSFRKIPEEKSANAMSLVAAADYEVRFRENSLPEGCVFGNGLEEKWAAFCAQEQILVTKKTKKGERELDLKPLIYDTRCQEDSIFLQLSAGSAENVKPELVLEAFAAYAGFILPEFALLLHRKELYANLAAEGEPRRLVSLEDLGEEF